MFTHTHNKHIRVMFMVEVEGLGCSLRRLKRVSMLASGCRKTPTTDGIACPKEGTGRGISSHGYSFSTAPPQ